MGRDMLLKFEAPPMIDLPGICAVAIAWASAWWLDKEVPTFKGGNPEPEASILRELFKALVLLGMACATVRVASWLEISCSRSLARWLIT